MDYRPLGPHKHSHDLHESAEVVIVIAHVIFLIFLSTCVFAILYHVRDHGGEPDPGPNNHGGMGDMPDNYLLYNTDQ